MRTAIYAFIVVTGGKHMHPCSRDAQQLFSVQSVDHHCSVMHNQCVLHHTTSLVMPCIKPLAWLLPSECLRGAQSVVVTGRR